MGRSKRPMRLWLETVGKSLVMLETVVTRYGVSKV
jgi:hypothetical protein